MTAPAKNGILGHNTVIGPDQVEDQADLYHTGQVEDLHHIGSVHTGHFQLGSVVEENNSNGAHHNRF